MLLVAQLVFSIRFHSEKEQVFESKQETTLIKINNMVGNVSANNNNDLAVDASSVKSKINMASRDIVEWKDGFCCVEFLSRLKQLVRSTKFP